MSSRRGRRLSACSAEPPAARARPTQVTSFVQRALAHLPTLRTAGRRLTRSDADAEDLAQETIVRALERRGDLRDPERMGAWLLAIQRTVHLNGCRGLGTRLEVLQGGRAEAPEPCSDDTPETALLEAALDPALAAALDALPEDWRQALWLREVNELSYEEIARTQGCPIGTVRSRLARARQALQLKLAPRTGGEHVEL